MRKITKDRINKAYKNFAIKLNDCYEKYDACIVKYANEEFNHSIKPYCINNKLNFKTGNGCWILYRDGEKLHLRDSEIPAHILNILNYEITGFNGYQMFGYMLSLFMDDFIYSDYIKKIELEA
jgi:hypothetical protein